MAGKVLSEELMSELVEPVSGPRESGRNTGGENGSYEDREEGPSMVCPKYGTAAWVIRVGAPNRVDSVVG